MAGACATAPFPSTASDVELVRLPSGGVQPHGVSRDSVLHVVYLVGEPAKADVYYVRSSDGGGTFSEPVRVNSQAGSAVASGTIRGAQVAAGPNGAVHVVWNGSSAARPKGPLNPEQPADSPHNGTPLLYSRVTPDGSFEPQRNLMTSTFGLDGGAAITAGEAGAVTALWHAKGPGAEEGEAGRRVWVARSEDGGETFGPERAVFGAGKGTCACCGMGALTTASGEVLALYRSAREIVHRDVYLLRSAEGGEAFEGRVLDEWEIGACPMSSMSFLETPDGAVGAWETAGQIRFGILDEPGEIRSAPGASADRKHPRLARDAAGRTLLVWTEARGWAKPSSLHWQLYAADGEPVGAAGKVDEIPVWSVGLPIARPGGGFRILY